jgi:putative nucleotidyltransferase with HDIG domain
MNDYLFIRVGEAVKSDSFIGLMVLDRDFKILFINGALCKVWKVTLGQVVNKNVVEIFYEGKKRRRNGEYYDPLLEVLDTQQEISGREVYLFNRYTGVGSWFLIHACLVKNCGGQPEFAVGTYVPIDKYKAMENKLDNLNIKIINAFCKAIGLRDEYTLRHSDKVAGLMLGFAEFLKLSADEVTLACLAGMVHDIGKIGISEQILSKPGILTESEFEIIKRHPGKGADILAEVEEFSVMAQIVRNHHERYDGKGYPNRLSGEEIPFLSRMLSLCDAFDAMTSVRCYCRPRTNKQALGEIQACAGKQFDPKLALLFIDFINQCGDFDQTCETESA